MLLIYLLLSGINAINPGPCAKCLRPGRKNQLSIICKKCNLSYHRTCVEPLPSYRDCHLQITNSTWTCHDCDSTTTTSCIICIKQDLKNKVKCSKCDGRYHRPCLRKLHPKYRSNSIDWVCMTCSLNTTITTPTIHPPHNQLSLLRGIKIGHINIRDLLSKSKKDDITSLSQSLNFDVFCVSESWLTDEISDDEIQIPNYHVLRADRPGIKTHKERGGGVIAYVKEDYDIQILQSPFSS